MIQNHFSLKISHLHNWVEYQNRVRILAESQFKQPLLNQLVEGRVYNDSLFLNTQIPLSSQQNVKLSFKMSTGAHLGDTTINISALKSVKRRYYPLAPSNMNVVEVELINIGKKLQESQFSFRSNSQLNARKGWFESRSDLKQKYKDTETELVRSISEYHKSVDKMTNIGKELNNIRREIKSRSRSKSKLMSLKEAISESNLKFEETVHPYVGVAKRSKKTTPESSNSTERIVRKYPTTSTLPDDDYGMFTSRQSHKIKKQISK